MKKPPEKDNSERYLLTYADLMNLLLILFIVLYSMSKTDVQKATQVANAIRGGFNAAALTTSSSSGTASSVQGGGGTASSGSDYSGFYDKLIALINQAGLSNQVTVVSDSSDVVITLKDSALYASGSATMNPEAVNLMTSIAGLLKQVDYAMIMIEGYTDTDPIHTSQFQDNLDLSTARASNVFRLLSSCGVPADKMTSTGYGEWHPVAPNDTVSNKALNRRVVLTIFKNAHNLTPTQIIAAKELLGLDSSLSSQAALQSAASGSSTASSSAVSSASSAASSGSQNSSAKSSGGKSSSASSSKKSSAADSVPK